MGAFWQRDPDPFTVSRDRTPMIFAPGAGYRYSNPGMALLAYCVTAAWPRGLPGAPQSDLRTLLADRVYGPIGLRDGDWSIGYRTPYAVDGLTLWANWGGGAFTARAAARIGRLMLRGGDWQGEQLLDPEWVAQALAYAGTPLPPRGGEPAPASGLCWYVNEDGVWPDVPRDAFGGAGAGQQLLLVVPSLELIVVRFGEHLGPDRRAGFWRHAYERVFAPVLRTLRP
jgi:CubicO group peptidase (beta-lactamase class C family)